MVDNDELIKRVINYLDNCNVLAGSPVFEMVQAAGLVPVIEPQCHWEEYYMTPPYWQPGNMDFHKEVFENIESRLKKTSYTQVQEQALKDIPDSKDTIILELGSGYGVKGAGYLARHKPNATVILVSKDNEKDKKREAEFPPKYLFIDNPNFVHRLVFDRGQNLLEEKDMEAKVNGLYRANGMNNVTFHEYELKIEDAINGTLPGFIEDMRGKDIYLYGFNSPKELPFTIGVLYNDLNARFMSVSLSAQERKATDALSWNHVQRGLGLDDDLMRGMIASAHNPHKDFIPEKYDYKDESQKRIGVMIKMAIALSLAKQVNGEVLRNTDNNMPLSYNKPDHYVHAHR